MSRIAGAAGARVDLGAMLAACRAGAAPNAPGARDHVAAGLGWTGTGEPALHSEHGLTVVLDGAIYNRDAGAPSDAAYVARLTREVGFAEALKRLNGDFAIAVWDEGERTLWLARDRIGVRPLYYARPDGGLAFASRPRALLELDGVSKAVDRTFTALFAASHYRTIDNDLHGSPFADVRQLPAAHLLRFRGGDVSVEPYWRLEDSGDLDGEPAELAERYRELLLDAVGIRVARAASPAFTLSGGMDSSTVLASAVRARGAKQDAFSSLYGSHEFDEADEIRTMLDSAVSEWHQVAVEKPDVFGLVGEMIEAHDEPVVSATWLSHHLVCREVAAGGFDTLFGGLGGDELNAGEYEYFLFRFADLRAAGEEDQLRAEVEAWVQHHDHPVFRKGWDVMEAGLAKMVDLGEPGRIRPDRARIDRYRATLDPEFFDLAAWQPVMESPFRSYLKNRTYQDMVFETAPPCLRAEDRQTAAHGLVNSDPFFDHRLVEFMFRVPGEQKIRDGVTKRLLRDATAGLLPDETRLRIKKTGWNAPADQWFAGDGREALLDLVGSQSFRQRGIYDLAEVRRLVDEHDEIVTSGRVAENHMMFFWQLVNTELWLRWLDSL